MKEYDNFSETFAKSRRNMHWPEIEYFMKDFKPGFEADVGNPNILDIGCGSGRLIPYLERALGKFTYLGVDSSEGMAEEAKKAYPEYEFSVLDMSDIGKLDAKFDLIFFIASFHHLGSEEKRLEALISLKKIMNPQSRVYMTNWNLLGERNFPKYEKMHQGNGDFNIKIGAHSRYYHSFSIEELANLFVKASFEIVENRIFETGNNIVSIIK